MITFEYRGYDQQGSGRKGLIDALDVKDARERLVRQGILPESVSLPGTQRMSGIRLRNPGFPPEFRSVFYRECAAFLGAGFTLVQSLDQMIGSPEAEVHQNALARLRDDIREGQSFSAAFESVSAAGSFEVSVLEVGEETGTLQMVCEQLADYLDSEAEVRDRIRSALIYPSIILVLASTVGMIMLSWLLPRYNDMMIEAGVELPLLTRAMMTVGDLSGTVVLPLMLLTAVLLGYRKLRSRRDRELAIRMDRQRYALPVVGPIYRLLVNLRFSRTLAILLNGGVNLVDGLLHAARATGSPWVVALVEKEQPSVLQGGTVADAISRMVPLAGSLTGWLRAGEASGDVASLMEGASTRLEQKWNREITRALALLEPALLLIVGVFVLLVMLAILLPINAMREGMGGF